MSPKKDVWAGGEAIVSDWSCLNASFPSFFFFLGHPRGGGNALTNTAASDTQMHNHTRRHAGRKGEWDRSIAVTRSVGFFFFSLPPLLPPIISKNKPSVSDPGPIRSETGAHWPTGGAAIPVTNCWHLQWQQTFTAFSLPHTCIHTLWPIFILLLCHFPLSPPPIHFHPSIHPPLSLSFFYFLLLNRCCLRYYLCYTNQINRRHSFFLKLLKNVYYWAACGESLKTKWDFFFF